ncbi:TraR/DksA family transcriptional regulator [Streptomyces sp. NBC_00670]|jgi:DnaK suppressor protein|uniref:TraR/DksA family transcriptional regulator n=1 Tax=Streptomyces sp. NBC_00670 TaxID=2975804 RepID=UPI002E3580CE|nr:TraR/DksA C4-type zinc finger protein [Streptomyces sp. NBC_00670]
MPTEEELSARDLDDLRARLTAQEEGLRAELAAVDAQTATLYTDCDLDAGDLGAKVTAADRLRSDAERARTLLERTRTALDRLGTPAYGRCTVCGEPIARDRLLAVPHADVCVRCGRGPDRTR